jgi:enoyl-[acyl-carrier protein] reductase II
MALVPQTVDAVRIPVLAAGGIADGRGLVAALALGAQGVIMGTRFIATPEAQADRRYQEAILRSGESDTVRTRCYTGKPARAIRNPYNQAWERRANEILPFPAQVGVSIQEGVMDYMGVGRGTDPERTFMPAGQGMGLIREIKPAAEVVRDVMREAEETLEELSRLPG